MEKMDKRYETMAPAPRLPAPAPRLQRGAEGKAFVTPFDRRH